MFSTLALLVGLAGVYLALAPRVTAFFPDGDGPWPAYTPLKITFSQPMRQEAVAEALTIQPSVAGAIAWEGPTLVFTPTNPWPPGPVTVSLPAGVRSAPGVPAWLAWQATFTISAPQLIYLWPASGTVDLYALDVASGETRRLTDTRGVLNYAVDPHGLYAVVSARNEQGGADLMRWDRLSGDLTPLTDCGRATCQSPALSPQGQVVYLRDQSLWLLPSAGEPRRLSKTGHRITWASWSPDGWLAWYDATDQTYRFQSPDGRTQSLPSQTGEAGAWLPPGRDFVFPELLTTPGRFTSHLMRFNRGVNRTIDLSRDDTVEDFEPRPSPDGAWLAFTRKYLDAERWTPGRQLWLMRPDGSQARALTDTPNVHHRMLVWSPQGDRIAYVRVDQTDLSAPPEIWLYDLTTDETIRLVIGGLMPQWMP